MLNSATEETVSVPNGQLIGMFIRIILLTAITVIAVFLLSFEYGYHDSQVRTLDVSGRTYRLQTAVSPVVLQEGLGDRLNMPQDDGMLFVFKQPAQLCFWMKDMQFPLDMVWVTQQKKIDTILENVPVKSYPKSFCSHNKTLYVIELNAGEAVRSKLKPGELLNF